MAGSFGPQSPLSQACKTLLQRLEFRLDSPPWQANQIGRRQFVLHQPESLAQESLPTIPFDGRPGDLAGDH